MTFILDASVTLAWCFEDEATNHTNATLDAVQAVRAIVPCLWFFEISNGLVMATRRGRTTEKKVSNFLQLLAELPIDVEPPPKPTSPRAEAIREIAINETISAYDAAYLQLAMELHIPLATLDGEGKRTGLKQAAQRRGVAIYKSPLH